MHEFWFQWSDWSFQSGKTRNIVSSLLRIPSLETAGKENNSKQGKGKAFFSSEKVNVTLNISSVLTGSWVSLTLVGGVEGVAYNLSMLSNASTFVPIVEIDVIQALLIRENVARQSSTRSWSDYSRFQGFWGIASATNQHLLRFRGPSGQRGDMSAVPLPFLLGSACVATNDTFSGEGSGFFSLEFLGGDDGWFEGDISQYGIGCCSSLCCHEVAEFFNCNLCSHSFRDVVRYVTRPLSETVWLPVHYFLFVLSVSGVLYLLKITSLFEGVLTFRQQNREPFGASLSSALRAGSLVSLSTYALAIR